MLLVESPVSVPLHFIGVVGSKCFGSKTMIDQRDVQVCNRGCCIYVNSQRLTKEEYNESVATGEIGRYTQISCMGERGSKVVRAAANKVGFYFGLPFPSPQIDPKDALVYDAKSHRYLRMATAEDAGKWLGALKSKR
jgi:hypothetical protein